MLYFPCLMVHFYLLLVVFLLALQPGRLCAQPALPVATVASRPAAPLATSPVAPDTAAALRRLFAQRRHRSHIGLGAGAGGLLASSILMGTASGIKGLAPFALGVVGVAVSVSGLVISLLHAIDYSEAHERRLLQALQQHRLPPYWSQRALRSEYTQAPE